MATFWAIVSDKRQFYQISPRSEEDPAALCIFLTREEAEAHLRKAAGVVGRAEVLPVEVSGCQGEFERAFGPASAEVDSRYERGPVV
jgi:hypothetical protein